MQGLLVLRCPKQLQLLLFVTCTKMVNTFLPVALGLIFFCRFLFLSCPGCVASRPAGLCLSKRGKPTLPTFVVSPLAVINQPLVALPRIRSRRTPIRRSLSWLPLRWVHSRWAHSSHRWFSVGSLLLVPPNHYWFAVVLLFELNVPQLSLLIACGAPQSSVVFCGITVTGASHPLLVCCGAPF